MLWPPLDLWACAFAATCLFEVPIVVGLTRGVFRRTGHAAVVGFGLQLLTHPALWYAVPQFEPRWAYLWVAETGVTATEALALYAAARLIGRVRLPLWRAALVSVVANTVTTLIGLWMVPWMMTLLGYA